MLNVILKSAFFIGDINLATKAHGTSNSWQAVRGSLKGDSRKK